MPTLEDTVDFKAVTLNDLLEAEATSGVSPDAADAGKYRLWFKISSMAAGLLAVLLVVALITGGDDDGGGGGGSSKILEAEAEAGTTAIPLSVRPDAIPGGTEAGKPISVLSADGTVLASGATVLAIETTGKGINQFTKLDLAIPDADATAVQTADASTLLFRAGTVEKPPATTATTVPPAATTETVPAPAPVEPAPAPAPPS